MTPEKFAEIKQSSAEGYSYRGESGELPGLERAKDDVKALVAEVERLRGVVKLLRGELLIVAPASVVPLGTRDEVLNVLAEATALEAGDG